MPSLYAASGTLHSLFMSLHGPAGACILVDSTPSIHVLPTFCGSHEQYILYIHTC